MSKTCGVPTFTCILLLLFMAALYASASARNNDGSFRYKMNEEELDFQQADGAHSVHVRKARSPQGNFDSMMSHVNANNRGRQGRIADSGDEADRGINNRGGPYRRRGGGRRGGGGRRRRPRPTGGRRRPGNRRGQPDGIRLPPDVTRRTMRLAQRLHQASSHFAAQLFTTIHPTASQNTLISPYSVHAALSMTRLGARGRTAREMANVLGLRRARLRNMKAHQAYRGLMLHMTHLHQNVHLYTANAVFVRPNIPLEVSFRQGLNQYYSAKFENFDFNHPQGAEGPINQWVANSTRNRIQDLIPPRTITARTAMIIVNAVYFNASWEIPFNPRLTRPENFHSLSQGVKSVDMMRNEGYYSYANHYNTEVVELNYTGEGLAMYIMLPNRNTHINQLLQEVASADTQTPSLLERLCEDLVPTNLDLIMPRFRIESGLLQLKEHLQAMGIDRAFDADRADFSGISASADLYITQVLHKSFIEVNEAGTEAAAATAVVIMERTQFAPNNPQELKLDRPFMFAISTKVTKAILFLGVYVGH